MKSKRFALIGGLGLLLVGTLCVGWVLMTRVLAGNGAPLVVGRLLNTQGRLAFIARYPADGPRIALINADGSNLTHLALISESLTVSPLLTWSPDARRLAFAAIGAEHAGSIALINGDGSGYIQLTNHGYAPVWSPDGTRLAYYSCCADRRSSIWSINADGSHSTQLTDGAITDFSPAWSPDGAWLAFASVGPDNQHSISVFNADGSGLKQLTQGIGGGPIWSPDGTHIAFVSAGTDPAGIYVVRADGSQLTQLTDDSQAGNSLAWSPDGTRLVFLSHSSGRPSLYVARADGSELTHLTNSWGRDLNPVWSPDSTRIAFIGNPWTIVGNVIEPDSPDGTGVFVINTDGSGLTRLTPRSIEVNEGPVWSPDGTALAFTAAEGQHRHDRPFRFTGVFVVRADGTAMARLADSGSSPVWMPK